MYAKRFSLALALIFVAGATSSWAAGDANRPGVASERAARAALLVPHAAGTGQAKELVPNASRAYPASCFSDMQPSAPGNIEPLPITPSGPTYGGTITAAAYDNVNKVATTENLTVTIWRVPCSSSGDKLSYNPDGGPVAATLVRLTRSSANEGNTDVFPEFPNLGIAQGSVTFSDSNLDYYVRAATEPNTVIADAYGSTFVYSTTYVLENYAGANIFAFNQAFQIQFDNGNTNGQFIFSVPDYNPTPSTYPAASQPLPIDGYLSGSWYDPTHSGEGILTQVYDQNGTIRTFAATWYTFDSSGRPFWLVAAGSFTIGATSIQNLPVFYRTGGGFAGNFTPPLAQPSWGTMSVSFPNCNQMTFTYNGTTASGITPPVAGSGTKTFSRIGVLNSLACQ